jgi:hypothetical protein
MVDRGDLIKRWVHSHEEDTSDALVYRAADSGHHFPPARGRTSFELHEDGSYVERGPGPTDRPSDRTGRWDLEGGEKLVLTPDLPDDPRQVLEISTATGDIITVKK